MTAADVTRIARIVTETLAAGGVTLLDDEAKMVAVAVLDAQHPAAPMGDVATRVRDAIADTVHVASEAAEATERVLSVLPAAPVAVDVATVARALSSHRLLAQDAHRAQLLHWACSCGREVTGYDSFARTQAHSAHQAAEVMRALAARDEEADRG